MSFVVEYAKPVAGEVQEILDWYKAKSLSAAINFVSQLNIAEKIFRKIHSLIVSFQTRVSEELS